MSRCQVLDLINNEAINTGVDESVHDWYLKAIHQLDYNDNIIQMDNSHPDLDMIALCKIFAETTKGLKAAEVDSQYFAATGNHLPCAATTDDVNHFLGQFSLLTSETDEEGETVFRVFEAAPVSPAPSRCSYRSNRLCSMSSYSSFDNASWGHSTVYDFEVLCGGDGTDPAIADLLDGFSNICVDDEVDVDPETQSIASQG
uniref:Uncharacterized protein n=1 Tax=Panagrellus redivivus TaxID=6233 RepID=A0A7E4VC22_PANRE